MKNILKLIPFIFFILLSQYDLLGQSHTLSVLSCGYDHSVSGDLQLFSNIGESIVGFRSQSEFSLESGFLQNINSEVVSNPEVVESACGEIEILNTIGNSRGLMWNNLKTGAHVIKVFHRNGHLLLTTTIENGVEYFGEELSQGVYLYTLSAPNGDVCIQSALNIE